MSRAPEPNRSTGDDRAELLADLPVSERRLELAGISTAVLEGGDGPPMLLLHGPGEFAAGWLTVLPLLVGTHHVVVPDLPGHGASPLPAGEALDSERIMRWLAELVEQTCPEPPVLVGRVIGGAIGARFAIDHPHRLSRLVLVDTLGLTAFAPDPRFGLAMHRFFAAPEVGNYERFMDLCAFDLDAVRIRLGSRWAAFERYAVALAADPGVQAATGALIGVFAAAALPTAELAGIEVPTTLIWGRQDLATPLAVAESASLRYGWALQVIEAAGDDPALEQPEAFVAAVTAALALVAVA